MDHKTRRRTRAALLCSAVAFSGDDILVSASTDDKFKRVTAAVFEGSEQSGRTGPESNGFTISVKDSSHSAQSCLWSDAQA